MRQFQITLPEEKVGQVMEFLEEKEQIRNIAKIHTAPGFMLIFRVSPARSSKILADLETIGVGVHYGLIDVLPVEASKPMTEEAVTITPTERLSVEEIYSPVIIVASMLLAPLMGPILGLSFGVIIKDRRLIETGIKNEALGLAIAIFMGIIMGAILMFLTFLPSWPTEWAWPTPEMASRALLWVLILGMAVAAASGAGVALAATRGDLGSLVGVAIAASLMPPAVNAGMNFIFAFLMLGMGNPVAYNLHIVISGLSFLLVILNILFINIVAMFVFKLKQVAPIKSKSIFWHDIPNLDKKRREELWHR
jgi:MFS family permease